jgi:uncharacterized protein YggE
MKKLYSTIALAIIFLASYGQEMRKNLSEQSFIEVNGYAERLITPNRIYLKIVVNEKDHKGKTLDEVETSMITKLQEIGIDVSKELVIKDFISNFKIYWFLKSDVLLMKEYQLLVYDSKNACKVIIEFEKLGISNVSIDKLDHSDIEKFRREVKLEAIRSAKENANALAGAIDQQIGRAIYISENGSNSNMTSAFKSQAAGIMMRGVGSVKGLYGSKAPEPDIEFEKIKLDYNIIVGFELK